MTPLARLPIDLTMGAAFRNLGPTKKEQVADDYTPFEGSFTTRTIYAGVTFTRRREP